MKELVLAIQKIVAAIVAAVCSISFTVPALPPQRPNVNVTPSSKVEQRIDKSEEEKPAAEENNDAAQADTENNAANETDDVNVDIPSINGTEIGKNEEAAPVYDAVATWDISAGENDNVTMSYYDTEDVDGLLAQLAGNVKALFVPMTALAADVTVITGKERTDLHDEDGQPYENGTVVVYGEGTMKDQVYTNFMTVESYLREAERAMTEYYGTEVKAVYDEGLTDIMQIDLNARWFVTEGNEEYPEDTEVFGNEEIRALINPANMLEYSPKRLVILEGVETVSTAAFAMCANITEIQFPSTLKEIEPSAFAYCTGLTKVVFNNGLERIDDSAFLQCRELREVVIPNSLRFVDLDAFAYIADGSRIICPTLEIAAMFNNTIFTEGRTIVEA